MTNSDAILLFIFLVGFLFVLPCGVAFYPFLILRTQVFTLAKEKFPRDPAALFYSAFLRSILWGMLFLFIVFVPCAGQMFFVLGGLGGYIGWLVLAIQGWRQRRALQQIHYAPPRLQFGITDLYTGVLAYGLSMSLLLTLFPEGKYRDTYTLFGTFYLLIAQGFGFYIAQDLLRRITPPASPGCRAKYLLNIAMLASLFLPLVWLTWRSWQYALRQRALTPSPPPISPARMGSAKPPPGTPPQPAPQNSGPGSSSSQP